MQKTLKSITNAREIKTAELYGVDVRTVTLKSITLAREIKTLAALAASEASFAP